MLTRTSINSCAELLWPSLVGRPSHKIGKAPEQFAKVRFTLGEKMEGGLASMFCGPRVMVLLRLDPYHRIVAVESAFATRR